MSVDDQENFRLYPDTPADDEDEVCIHNLNTYCRKWKHACDGAGDTNRCPEWQIVAQLHALRKCIQGLKGTVVAVVDPVVKP